MIKSMTGYGRAQQDTGSKLITVEIKSVNHRFYDFSARVPRMYGFLEEALKTFIGAHIKRGKVDVYVSVEDNASEPAEVQINKSLLAGYLNAFRQISKEYKLKNDVTVSSVSQFKDIFSVKKAEEDHEQIIKDVLGAAAEAVKSLTSMREAEGKKLSADIIRRCEAIKAIVDKIEERSPATVTEYREKLLQRMRDVLGTAGIDEQRILTEAAMFADKITVAEETVRLKSHIAQVEEILKSGEAIGKKLDFMVQEMNREVNTIGSKANDIIISHYVVSAKSEIENIREQVQNIE